MSPESTSARQPGNHRVVRLALALGAVVLAAAVAAASFTAGWATHRNSSPAPNAADIGYLQDMSTHHGQAVAMSVAILDRPVEPGVREAARRILLEQQAEIGTMQGWLQLWDAPSQGAVEMAWTRDSRSHAHATAEGQPATVMPGTVSADQLAELSSLPAEQAGERFVELMIGHHRGGIDMAREARRRANVDAVRRLAQRAEESQFLEIAQLEHLTIATP